MIGLYCSCKVGKYTNKDGRLPEGMLGPLWGLETDGWEKENAFLSFFFYPVTNVFVCVLKLFMKEWRAES